MEFFMRQKEKRQERKKKLVQLQAQWRYHLEKYGMDILYSDNFKKTDSYIQHGTMTLTDHCINVAIYSLIISKKLRINCNQRELVRGALLHDYFLYDWHDKTRVTLCRLHGFHHPGIALKNANLEYSLSAREKDIIKKHMWPLTITPPLCREAWVVTAADKYCSLLETLHLHQGRGKSMQKNKEKIQYQG